MRSQRPAAITAATVICVLNSLGNLAILPADRSPDRLSTRAAWQPWLASSVRMGSGG
jgi:hypothetical protein